MAQSLFDSVMKTVREHDMASSENVALLLGSGGSDSTALAYLAAQMVAAGELGAVSMLHVNHKLRGRSIGWGRRLRGRFGFKTEILCSSAMSRYRRDGSQYLRGNMEAIAREERYRAAREAGKHMSSSGIFLEAIVFSLPIRRMTGLRTLHALHCRYGAGRLSRHEARCHDRRVPRVQAPA
ncbi:MAG: ATP-binding protein [Eggerthellaceae bacterium]